MTFTLVTFLSGSLFTDSTAASIESGQVTGNLRRRQLTGTEGDICTFPRPDGSSKCKMIKMRTRYYFDSDDNECKQFSYRGCDEKNENNFTSMNACDTRCINERTNEQINEQINEKAFRNTCYYMGKCENRDSASYFRYKDGWKRNATIIDLGPCASKAQEVFDDCNNSDELPITSIFYNAYGEGTKTIYPGTGNSLPLGTASFFDFRIKFPCPPGWEPINTERDCKRAAANSKIFEFVPSPGPTPPGPTGPLVCYRSNNQDDGIKFLFNLDQEKKNRPHVCKKAE